MALMVTSPPSHVGKDYDSDASYGEFLGLLRRVFAETHRVLERSPPSVPELRDYPIHHKP